MRPRRSRAERYSSHRGVLECRRVPNVEKAGQRGPRPSSTGGAAIGPQLEAGLAVEAKCDAAKRNMYGCPSRIRRSHAMVSDDLRDRSMDRHRITRLLAWPPALHGPLLLRSVDDPRHVVHQLCGGLEQGEGQT